MNQPFKPKKRVWTPPSKQEHRKSVKTIKSTGGFSDLQKYVGTEHKPKRPKSSKQPTGQVYELYAQGKELNSGFEWQSKEGLVAISTLDTKHLVGILGYLYWGNHKHQWLVDPDTSKSYSQHSYTFTATYVREAFDAVLVELVKLRKSELTPPYVDSIRKIVKHVVVVRSKLKKKAKPQQPITA